MASVSGPNMAPTYHEGRPNQILRITPMLPMMVVCTDGDGKEVSVVVWTFGKMKDGRVGVFLGATPQQVRENIKVPSHAFIDNMRAKMEEKGYLRENGELAFFQLDDLASGVNIDTSVFDDTSSGEG
jgi:hypothetical protein